jgi:hypothetical protein
MLQRIANPLEAVALSLLRKELLVLQREKLVLLMFKGRLKLLPEELLVLLWENEAGGQVLEKQCFREQLH